MVSPQTAFRPSRFTELVTHLQSFDDRQRAKLAEIYGTDQGEAAGLAEFMVANPSRVVEVIRRELTTSTGWRLLEDAVVDHDLPIPLDWAPPAQRRELQKLGLVRMTVTPEGATVASLPGALAAILADRVEPARASLPILLGRQSRDEVQRIARAWDLPAGGSKIEILLRISDHFYSPQIGPQILERLPNPDWVGDALMVLELGGFCHWNQVYSFDLEERLGAQTKVVPLMKSDERAMQRDVAETLEELGILFRVAMGEADHQGLAVPEELWPALWQQGRRWLMDWNREAQWILLDEVHQRGVPPRPVELQHIYRWWLVEAKGDRLRHDGEEGELTPGTLRRLREVYHGPGEPDWQGAWRLARELLIFEENPYGSVRVGGQARSLLEGTPRELVGHGLLEWCLSYSGEAADEKLALAIGLDDAWRGQAVELMKRHGEPVPPWFTRRGVEPGATGGGWLREPGTGPEDLVLFEVGLTSAFVLTTKLLWLDLLSLLDQEGNYFRDGLVQSMQCAAGLAMFQQLQRILEEQPAPLYLPFLRASFLMDQRHHSQVGEWVDDVIREVLVPLGCAVVDDEQWVWLRPGRLEVPNPPGWTTEFRREFLEEIFETELTFEAGDRSRPAIRAVAPVAARDEGRIAIDEDFDELLRLTQGRLVESFDGMALTLSEDGEEQPASN